jgi:hypothetical protein
MAVRAGIASSSCILAASALESLMQPSQPGSGFAFLAAVVLAVVAVVRSPRKLHTSLYILSAMLICALVATGVGFAFGSAAAGSVHWGELRRLLNASGVEQSTT